MKKNLIILILAIFTISSMIFGYTQKVRADEQEALAKEYAMIAEEEKRRAEIQTEMALEQRKNAEHAAEIAREQMLSALEHMKKKQNEAE